MTDRESLLPDRWRGALRDDVPAEDHLEDARLARYLDGSVAPEDRESIESHVGRCAQCAEDLAAAVRVEADAAARAEVPLVELPRIDLAPTRARAPRTIGLGTVFKIAAGLVLVIGAVVAGRETGRFVSSQLQPLVVARLGEWSGRFVSADRASLVLLRGPGIAVSNLEISDDPRFSEERFARFERAEVLADPGALLRGKLRGSVVLERPSLRLVRDRLGTWNVETLGRDGEESVSVDEADLDRAREQVRQASRGEIEEPPVQISSADIRNGTLEIEDLGGTKKSLRLQGVSLTYRGSDGAAGTLDLSGQVGSADDRVVVRGRIGPFDTAADPTYRLSEVELARVPVRDIPGAPVAVEGDLSFTGHVTATGRSLDAVIRSARGAGRLDVERGSIGGRNLAADVLAQIDRAVEPAAGAGNLLAVARERADLATVLADDATRFERLGGSMDLQPETMRFRSLAIQTSVFAADANVSLDLEGALAATGSVRLAPELGAIVVAAVPELSGLRDAKGALALPFRASGTWSSLDLSVDVERVAALLAPRTPGPFAGLDLFRALSAGGAAARDPLRG